ncbi:MAG: hypothetical protein DRP18_01360 [Candidatus Aenigmatarchaeota archaeon]|nr:MAG: hypothetical protein DRP18_01360 [Candidatus Aenigmarchaeota archaeon]
MGSFLDIVTAGFAAFQHMFSGMDPLLHIGLILIIATFIAYLAKIFRQPLIVAYVLAGILIGPMGFGLIKNTSEITALAELGIAFLLFTVGLELDFQKLRNVGAVSVGGGIIQVVLTFVLGFFVSEWLGFNSTTSVYIGLLVAFSSTMIVTKFLVDRNEINTLHSRIMLGILLLQDIMVIMILPVLTTQTALSLEILATIFIKGFGLFSIAVVLNRFVFKRILDYAAETYEILFMTAISICFLFIGLAVALGFPVSIGAFIGGLAIASFPYNLEIEGEIHSLRDFFAVIFFVSLGMSINLMVVYNMFFEFLVILFVILLIKPLILSIIYLLLGYGGRNASRIGLGLAQASEFSFILATQGLLLGHLNTQNYSFILSIVVISMVTTPYFMQFRNNFYRFFSNIQPSFLKKKITSKRVQKIEKHPKKSLENHIIIFGAHRMGGRIIEYLKKKKKNFIVVENNPEIVKRLSNEGVYCKYADADNEDILRVVGLYKANLAVITVPNNEIACFVTRRAKRFNPVIKIFARAHSVQEAENLYNCGADFVVVPEFESSEKIIQRIEDFFQKGTG